MIGEDADLKKSGRILNRVIESNRDGITIEADQRHVRDNEGPRAGASKPICDSMCRGEEGWQQGAQRGQGQTQTEHEWDDVNTCDDMDRPQMADDDGNDGQALTVVSPRCTEHSLHESVTCHKIDQISSLHRCRYVARWQSRQSAKRIGRYLVGKPRAKCWFRWATEW